MNLNLNGRTLRRQFWVALAVGVIAAGAFHTLAGSEGGPAKKTAPIAEPLRRDSFLRGE
jgi:hypothetical protein